jgi:predicted porin
MYGLPLADTRNGPSFSDREKKVHAIGGQAMRKLFYALLCISIMFLGGKVFAEEIESNTTAQNGGDEAPSQEEAYSFPRMKPEIWVFGGYRFVSNDGSPRAEEYEYLHDSIALGGKLRMFSFPHRLHLDLDVKNEKDYFGDITYMYKDIVRFRTIETSLFHNLENVSLIDLDPSTPSPGVDVRDANEQYGIRFGMTNVFLRFKTPDYPFHVYLEGSLLERSGAQQQRSLLGSGTTGNVVRTSQSRDVDQDTKNLTIGANTHLGPVELDISHGEKRFKEEADKVLYDFYSSSPARAAGEYPHNLVPDLRGSSNTLKVHTSYTGRLVASATLSKIDRENSDSGAKADYFIGAGEISWMESPRLAFFLKYRHRESDIDNPDTVTITDATNPLNSYTYAVEPSISSVTDSVSAIIRYRLAKGVTAKGEYSYENIRRSVSLEWDLPNSTEKNVASLSADLRVIKGVQVKVGYTHKFNYDPAYNTEPDRSDEGKMSVSLSPHPKVTALVSFAVADERRDDLHFTDTLAARNREVNRESLLGSLTYLLLDDLSVTASYAYAHNKTRQDIVYDDITGLPRTDPLVPNTDLMHHYALDFSYLPKNNITLGAGVSYTISRGAFYPSDANLLMPVSIASFAELKTKELLCSFSGEYRFKGGFGLGAEYRYADFDDVLDNPNDDVVDGKAHIILLTLSKRW